MKFFVQFFVIATFLIACNTSENKEKSIDASIVLPREAPQLTFKSTSISDSAKLWWARTLADVDGDGILDVPLHDNNGSGGWMGYLKGNTDGKTWQTIIVAEETPNGNKFAAGDLAAADLDNDGDIDLIGVEHPGEWSNADADALLFWYEQDGSDWIDHKVGTIPSALKDIEIADLDKDGNPEIVTVTYNAETLSVFQRGNDKDFEKAWDLKINNLHEGLGLGDLNGNGLIDIAANGYWLENPGNLNKVWELKTIDDMWYSQEEEHWSRNATKVVCLDIDNDNKAEVFISHSEKSGYPIAKYDWENGEWKKEILAEDLPAAHSLQVADMDLDGTYEVLSGVNRNRAINIAEELKLEEKPSTFPVVILKQNGSNWTSTTINESGVYNLLAGDFEGDGDIDLIRLTSHDEKDMWLMENEINN